MEKKTIIEIKLVKACDCIYKVFVYITGLAIQCWNPFCINSNMNDPNEYHILNEVHVVDYLGSFHNTNNLM